jgi:hypothetical protein
MHTLCSLPTIPCDQTVTDLSISDPEVGERISSDAHKHTIKVEDSGTKRGGIMRHVPVVKVWFFFGTRPPTGLLYLLCVT